jgi:rfaE bifunctional protein nucleotidyltransferase chain/domain
MNTDGPPLPDERPYSLAAVTACVEAARASGSRLVLTNGCFDLLHVGHVRYLQAARRLGDYLIVGVNSDASVRRLKGSTRPLVPAAERAEVVAALGCVDAVVIFDTATAEPLVAALRPDVYVKGHDYTEDTLPEAHLVRAYGGTVALLRTVPGASTTALIRRVTGGAGPTEWAPDIPPSDGGGSTSSIRHRLPPFPGRVRRVILQAPLGWGG